MFNDQIKRKHTIQWKINFNHFRLGFGLVHKYMILKKNKIKLDEFSAEQYISFLLFKYSENR